MGVGDAQKLALMMRGESYLETMATTSRTFRMHAE